MTKTKEDIIIKTLCQIEFGGLGINFHAPANPRSVFLTNAVCVSAKVDKLHRELHRGITGA